VSAHLRRVIAVRALIGLTLLAIAAVRAETSGAAAGAGGAR